MCAASIAHVYTYIAAQRMHTHPILNLQIFLPVGVLTAAPPPAARLDLSQAAVTSGSWAWQVEKMPGGRNMVDNVSRRHCSGLFMLKIHTWFAAAL